MPRRTVFANGCFHTFDRKLKLAEAIAVDNGRIVDIGTRTELRSLGRRGYSVIDLKKKCVVPGIIDSHIHLLSLGTHFSRVKLDGVDSLEKVKTILRKAASRLRPGQWLQGRGWNKNLWGEELPDKSILDAITGNPVALDSKDGHLLWVNSAALDYCRITSQTRNPEGGVIQRYASGEPTGILKENAADLVTDKIPSMTFDERRDAILLAQKHLLRLGITVAGDCDSERGLFEVYHELDRHGYLQLRVFKMISLRKLQRAIDFKFHTSFGTEHLRTGCLKLFVDGALGSQTAFMFKPYKGSRDNVGVQVLTLKELSDNISKAVNAGISVAIHAIGDKANHQALRGIGKYKDAFGEKGLRPRIEHAQVLRKSDIPLFKTYGIVASVQPIHATSDRDVADRYWGTRSRFAYPFRTFLRAGIRVAFGSDAPIETANPLAGIHAAVTRKRAGEDRPAWYPEERITARQAVDCYTQGSAYACCYDDIAGSITVGKQADFVVLSDDIFKIKSDEISGARVLMTVVDGEAAFGATSEGAW